MSVRCGMGVRGETPQARYECLAIHPKQVPLAD